MQTSETYFVRLKAYNKRKGYLCSNYMTGGVRFTTRWKEVSAAKAAELEDLCQPHSDDIPLFDIKTREEAEGIEQQEREDDVPGRVHAVKSAERVPDSAFRNDRLSVSAEDMLISVEKDSNPAKELDFADVDDAGSTKDADQVEMTADPVPSLRGSGKGRPRTRS